MKMLTCVGRGEVQMGLGNCMSKGMARIAAIKISVAVLAATLSACGMARDALLPAPGGAAHIHKIGGGLTPGLEIRLEKIEDVQTGAILYNEPVLVGKLLTEGVYTKVPAGTYRIHYQCLISDTGQKLPSESPVQLTVREGYRYISRIELYKQVQTMRYEGAYLAQICRGIYNERRWL